MGRIPQTLLPRGTSLLQPSSASSRLPIACTRCARSFTTSAPRPNVTPTIRASMDKIPLTRWDNMEHMGSETFELKAKEPAYLVQRYIQRTKAKEHIDDAALTQIFTDVFSDLGVHGAWQTTPLTDSSFKFAVVKALMQRTGRVIPDPVIHAARTAGDLFKYKHLRTPERKEKMAEKLARVELGPNVSVNWRRQTLQTKETARGRWKVVQKALMDRHLPAYSERYGWEQARVKKEVKAKKVAE